MSELQTKLERRRSRIEAFSPQRSFNADRSSSVQEESDPLSSYRDIFDAHSADRETLLELINICASMMPPGNRR
jgi:hypothetical protein